MNALLTMIGFDTDNISESLINLVKRFGTLVATCFLLGLSLLPLAVLLLALPAVLPQETILTNSIRRSRDVFSEPLRRLGAVVASIAMLITLIAFSVEVANRLPLPEFSYFETISRMLLPDRLIQEMPLALVRHWPYVILLVYATDLLALLFIGKVPLSYNIRNLTVRWRITLLTALAFTVVVALLVALLAFVNGMNNLNQNSGVPGNVFVLSDGALDELFSNLAYGNIDSIANEFTQVDENGNLLPSPVRVKTMPGMPDKFMMSKEIYCVINMPVRNPDGSETGKRRFVQLRGIEDPLIASAVHEILLNPNDGSKWFSDAGVDAEGNVQAVLGEGVAQTLGADQGKPRLEVGDKFELGNRTYVVTGIMLTEGKTFGSEIWARHTIVGNQFGKDKFTTVVLRVSDDSLEGAKSLANHLQKEFKTLKLKATPEVIYYSNLSRTNKQFLVAIMVVAAIMAIGGIFGVMNTMFAAIAQRIKDIGVLRILGFKRWQILVSFLLESLLIALIGGVFGVALGSLVDGYSATSILSSGPGGGKSVVLRIDVTPDIIVAGILFTMIMGRIGGLIPALSAMRLQILDSLR